MSKTVGYVACLAAVVGIVNEMAWISASTWYAGWIAVILAAVAGVMALINK